jgi:hypothetical protein
MSDDKYLRHHVKFHEHASIAADVVRIHEYTSVYKPTPCAGLCAFFVAGLPEESGATWPPNPVHQHGRN